MNKNNFTIPVELVFKGEIEVMANNKEEAEEIATERTYGILNLKIDDRYEDVKDWNFDIKPTEINVLKIKEDLLTYLKKDTSYFSEAHLDAWFKEQYQGKTKEEIIWKLENQSDNSIEIENAMSELGRILTDYEQELVEKRFIESVIDDIEFRNDIAIFWFNSLREVVK